VRCLLRVSRGFFAEYDDQGEVASAADINTRIAVPKCEFLIGHRSLSQ
jgi:hypothetical protein